MIRWCSFCQSFIGQSPPFNDFSFSHGICDKCNEKMERGEEVVISWDIKEFYDHLFQQIASGQTVDPDALLEKARQLGLKNHELLTGVLNPLLCKIGQYFEAGKISVAKEHLFSRSVNAILERVETDSVKTDPSIVFLVPDDNFHRIGVSMFRHLLMEKYGIATWIAETPPRGAAELENLLDSMAPVLVGVSVALPEHYVYVRHLCEWLEDRQDVKLVVGGPAAEAFKDFETVRDCALVAHVSDRFNTLESAESIRALIRDFSHPDNGNNPGR